MSNSDPASPPVPAPASGGGAVARLALRLALFLVPVAAIWGVLEAGLRRVDNSYTQKREQIKAMADEVDTVVVGASSVYFGISPRELSGTAYNLANICQGPYYDDQLLRKLAPELPKLRRVLAGVSYHSLTYQIYNSTEDWRQYYYVHAWGIPPVQEADRRNLKAWSMAALYPPNTVVDAVLAGFKFNVAPEMDDRGWFQVKYHEYKPLSEASAARAHRIFGKEVNEKNEPGNAASLESLLTLCQERHLETVLIVTPVSPAWADRMNAERWNRAETTYRRLAEKYGARYLSFLRDTRFEEPDFYDPTHLNAEGAVKFTKFLNETLQAQGAGGDAK